MAKYDDTRNPLSPNYRRPPPPEPYEPGPVMQMIGVVINRISPPSAETRKREWSERRDLNPRPLVPQTSALTGLRHAPTANDRR